MTEAELDRLLSEPTPRLVDACRRIEGDVMILGAGGKMGPSLARMLVRASHQASVHRRVFAVSRFSDRSVADALQHHGVDVVATDLFDPAGMASLPDVANVIFMAGRKFGTADDAAPTWATNAYLAGAVAQRFAGARIVAFSTGNVYPLADAAGQGPGETSPVGPVGEYAWAALARERILEFFSVRNGTPMAIIRINYAVEPRYGVLRDIADQVHRGDAVSVATGFVNVIWQRDANAIAVQALEHCATPPMILNVTGRPAHSVRELARGLGLRLGVPVQIRDAESTTALLSDAARCEALFGPAPVTMDRMLDLVADWVKGGGRSLGKPTHFAEREGRF